jgi:quercetin dioxygenase-like cupin family protein
MPDYCPLVAFIQWWLSNRQLRPPHDTGSLTFDDNVVGCTLYRAGQFQVQYFLVKPHSVLHSHSHPDVNSVEMIIHGDIDFHSDGVQRLTAEELVAAPEGHTMANGRFIHVPAGVMHGGTSGPIGGSFLSFQHWLHDTSPSCVSKNWEFEDADQEHRNEHVEGY